MMKINEIGVYLFLLGGWIIILCIRIWIFVYVLTNRKLTTGFGLMIYHVENFELFGNWDLGVVFWLGIMAP